MVVHTSGVFFRTALVTWRDVFLLLVGISSGLLGTVLVGLFVVKFWLSLCRVEDLLLNSKWMSLKFKHYMNDIIKTITPSSKMVTNLSNYNVSLQTNIKSLEEEIKSLKN